jgi:nitrous oxide reductase accessory protein NosL
VGQAREALRPHLLDQPGWERLRDAARAWEDARRAAYPLLSEAVEAMGTPEFTGLSAAYRAAIAAANAGYRCQYAQATGQGSEGS